MTQTPNSERLHIVLLGERNSGKSSLLNAITGQAAAIVSDIPGTTTDHISKAMEISDVGSCLIVDTAGLGDDGELGPKRVSDTLDALNSADIVLAVIDATSGRIPELPQCDVPIIPILNKCDMAGTELALAVKAKYGKSPIIASALHRTGIPDILSAIRKVVPEDWDLPIMTTGIIKEGELAVLVMPQDKQAPKGRLILPQQQTIRELLDRRCRIVCCTTENLVSSLQSLNETPAAIITDSRDFLTVKEHVPSGCVLTSFSILLAASKGDIAYFKESALKIDSLNAASRVLIAEACTHVPATEDIGRVIIPDMLRSRAGKDIQIEVVSGRDFPEDLRRYDLVIHCGACMFNRRYVLSRVRTAKEQGVPMTNYGIAMAHMNNIL